MRISRGGNSSINNKSWRHLLLQGLRLADWKIALILFISVHIQNNNYSYLENNVWFKIDELFLFRHIHQHNGKYISLSQLETARSLSNYFEAPQSRIAWHFIILWIFFVLEMWSENNALWLESIYLYIDRHVPYIFTLISPLTYCLCVRKHRPCIGNKNRARTF